MEKYNFWADPEDKPKKVLVAMSGGVDSAFAAFSLVQSGIEVVGIHFKMGDFEKAQTGPPRCCSIEDARDARIVSGALDIPFYVISLTDVFEKEIIIPFVKAYAKGLTPNPCIRCNPLIKWKYLFEKADELGMDAVATGHHARIVKDDDTGQVKLLCGPDKKKDQSYFLSRLTKDQLKRTVLPSGIYKKEDIRKELQKAGIAIADKAESQDVCFVGDGGYMEVVEKYLGAQKPVPGKIIDTGGKVLGEHQGIHHYTIGQRKGISISAAEPFYVIEILAESNTIIVGNWEECESEEAFIEDVHWIGLEPSSNDLLEIKIRYRSPQAPCRVFVEDGGRARVVFEKPQRSVTPGQTAVIYKGEEVLGSGTFIKGRVHE